jgi:hypothetical protein
VLRLRGVGAKKLQDARKFQHFHFSERRKKTSTNFKFKMVAVAMILVGLLAGQALGDFTLTDHQQLTVDTYYENGWLYDTSQATIVPGGQVSNELYTYNSSTANVSGGSVNVFLAHDSSTVRVYSGSVWCSDGYESSTVNVSGGTVSGALEAWNSIVLNVSGGAVSRLFAHQSSTVNISGGSVGNDVMEVIAAGDSSVINVSGGSINSPIRASDISIVNFSGGSMDLPCFLEANGHSIVNFSGGHVFALEASGHGHIEMTGGTVIAALSVADSGTMDIHGGFLRGFPEEPSFELSACNHGWVAFYGYDFVLGEGLSRDGDRILGTGYLSGEWWNGTPWTVDIFCNAPTATILIPEPATSALFGLGCLMMVRRRG